MAFELSALWYVTCVEPEEVFTSDNFITSCGLTNFLLIENMTLDSH